MSVEFTDCRDLQIKRYSMTIDRLVDEIAVLEFSLMKALRALKEVRDLKNNEIALLKKLES